MNKRITSLFLAFVIASFCVSCGESYKPAEDSSVSSVSSEVTTTQSIEPVESEESAPRELSEEELKDAAKKGYQATVDYINKTKESKSGELPSGIKAIFYTSAKDTSKLADLNNKISDTIGKTFKVEYRVNSADEVVSFRVWNKQNEDGACGEYTLEEYKADNKYDLTTLKGKSVEAYFAIIDCIADCLKNDNEDLIPTNKTVIIDTNKDYANYFAKINYEIKNKIGTNLQVVYKIDEDNYLEFVKIWNSSDENGDYAEYTISDWAETYRYTRSIMGVTEDDLKECSRALKETQVIQGMRGSLADMLDEVFYSYDKSKSSIAYETELYTNNEKKLLDVYYQYGYDFKVFRYTISGTYEPIAGTNLEYYGTIVFDLYPTLNQYAVVDDPDHIKDYLEARVFKRY